MAFSLPDLSTLPNLLIAFLTFLASLFFPLFLIPQLLLRRGVRPWVTRLWGWLTFGALLTLVSVIFSGIPSLADLVHWTVWVVVGSIAFAAWWDIRMIRMRSLEEERASPKS